LWAGIYWLTELCKDGVIAPVDAVVVLQQMVGADLPWDKNRQLELTHETLSKAVERYERMERDKFEALNAGIDLMLARMRTGATLPANTQTVPLPDEGILLQNGEAWRLVLNVQRSVELQALSVRITSKQQEVGQEACVLEQAESFVEVENVLRGRLEVGDLDAVLEHFRVTFARFIEQLSWEV
jgi:hypothetical protein